MLLAIFGFINLAFIPVQYIYLKNLSEDIGDKSQQKYYDDQPLGTQLTHFQLQGNFIILPANMIATFIYRQRRKKIKKQKSGGTK
nr:DUF3949 domain-containing protein [Halobacillus sp. A1]